MKSSFLASTCLLVAPFFLSGCIFDGLVTTSSHTTINKVIIDSPDPAATDHTITMTDTQSYKTYTLPHTFKFKNENIHPVIFKEAVADTFPTLQIGSKTYLIESDYAAPLKAYNQSSSTNTQQGNFTIFLLLNAEQNTEEHTKYLYIAPESLKNKMRQNETP